jgi:hypothetical protein
MNCPACGAYVPDTQENCDKCGAVVRAHQAGGYEQPGDRPYGQPGFNPGISYAASEYAPRYGSDSGDIKVTPLMVEHLRATRPWVKFLAILGFISVGLMFLGGLIMMAALSSVRGVGATPAIGLLYWLFALLYIAPAIFLNRYATAIRELLQGGGAPPMEKALESQKSFWRYVGILTVVLLCIYALIFVIAILVGISGALPR